MTFPRFLDCAYVLLHDDFNMDQEHLQKWAPVRPEREEKIDVAAQNTSAMQRFQAMMAGVRKA